MSATQRPTVAAPPMHATITVRDGDGSARQVEWHLVPEEVTRVCHMLCRASVFGEGATLLVNARDYRAKPWNWSFERRVCDRLEESMRECGVDPEDGWDTTCSTIVADGQRNQARRETR